MTKQEKTILTLMEQRVVCCEETEKDLYTFAIECIEKQIPKKPTTKEFNDSPKGMIETIAYCPNCGYSQGEIKPSVCYSIRMQKYIKYGSKYEKDSRNIGCCIACGQAIDWSDNE